MGKGGKRTNELDDKGGGDKEEETKRESRHDEFSTSKKHCKHFETR
jgi:hypothetical protein